MLQNEFVWLWKLHANIVRFSMLRAKFARLSMLQFSFIWFCMLLVKEWVDQMGVGVLKSLNFLDRP